MFRNENSLIFEHAITASGNKPVMKVCNTRRDEGIPPLKVMASLSGLQWGGLGVKGLHHM